MDAFYSSCLRFAENDEGTSGKGFGPCESQDPLWAKMSALATGVSKKRKKTETKPQAQINKCNNEKRRREQENIYIEELAELISANFADMSSLSVKPDKCAILQETVNQIRSIKQRESASQSRDPVQQGEVSSSRPTILSNEVYGPLLLEALEGFLFVVNAEGKVEHVTENVSNFIKFTKDEIFGNSIYNIIHLGDHARFTSFLMPMTIGWGSESTTTTTTTRSKSFSLRFLVKPPDDQDETVEEKQQRVSCYELMHISSTQLRDQAIPEDEGGDSGPYLLCVASRITARRDKVSVGIEQFTTKLDTSGKIIGVDVSGVSPQYSQFINKDLVDRALRDLVPQQEVHKFNAHLRDTINVGQSTSALYRLQFAPDKSVEVQTKSKLFKTNPHATTESDFIMATHSIVVEYDAIGPSDPGGGGGGSSGSGGVGGPLMTSVVNGTRNGAVPMSSGSDGSTISANMLMNTGSATSFTTYSIDNDFPFDIFPTSTFDLEPAGWVAESRPDSRQSTTPVSTPTPRPPSNPAYSPATTVAQSPLAQFTQPSPSTASNSYATTFPFSPLPDQNMEESKDTKANVMEDQSALMVDSAKLRNLLTKPPNVADSSANDADGRNKNRILKGLLNQQDEDDRNDNRASPRGGLMNRGSAAGPSDLPKTASAGGNNMLLQLLNERSDDDDNLEARAGVRKKSELLHQLLKNENREHDDEKKNDIQSHDDSLLRSLGFPITNTPSPPNGDSARGRKRPSDERDDSVTNKRSSEGTQVSSTGATTGGSKLCERNKMLASLLAKQPNQHPIPHLPSSVLTATPQDGLPRVPLPESTKNNKPMPARSTTSAAQQRTPVKNTLPDQMARISGRQSGTNYLNTILAHPNNIHHQRTNNRSIGGNQGDSGTYTSPATSSTDGNLDTSLWADNNNVHSNDPLLSDILDQVMDIVPDEVGRTFTHGEGQQANNFQNELSEKMAINIIQKSLMLCESVVKSPSSPTISLPGTPPAYTSTMTTQSSQMRSFVPPPNYHATGFISKQRISVRSGAPQYAVAGGNLSNAQQLLLQRKQQEERRRLLQQQQQQELLIPSNATAAEINSGLQNIDSLLNNTVAPNVSLQRSASLPESQLSPSYGGQLNQPTQRMNNQQPYSPHSQLVSPSAFPQTSSANYQQTGGARLSPQFNQQISLRQIYPPNAGQGQQNWQPTAQARLSVQNPMLNAQLTRAPNQQQPPQQQQQQQQQRSLNSPGTVPSRQSPYPQDTFPPPTSPNSAAFNQSQYLRLQRANSVPTATTQLPGGLGSPRPYGREHPPHPYPSLPPNPHPLMYQQDSSQYCYDQTGLQLAYNGADRGRAPHHLQAGVSGSGGPTSEFVRQELRAVVGARTGQGQTAPNRTTQSQLLNQQVDLDALALSSFELPTSGASDSPKLWGAMGSDMDSMSPQPATSRSSMEEARQGDHGNKSSLLQKLLSE